MVLVPWILGISEEVSAEVIAATLRVSGIQGVHFVAPAVFVVRDSAYEIEFWCTPSILPLCGIVLLWFARQRPLIYLLTSAGFTVLSGVLVFGNTVLSIHAHQRGVDWLWAHFPGAILVYSGLLLGCIAFAEFCQRAIERESSQEHTESHPCVTA